MSPTPTGQVVPTPQGIDLVLTRWVDVSHEEAWAHLTESGRTAVWFGPWVGEPGAGNTVTLTMIAEEGSPEMEVLIDACEPPDHLAVKVGDWHLEARVRHVDGGTAVELTHHVPAEGDVRDIGPGWEYYLDRLVAAIEGGAMPDFDDYYPAQSEYFARQLPT